MHISDLDLRPSVFVEEFDMRYDDEAGYYVDRLRVVSHPGSHFEVWVHQGPDLLKVYVVKLGDTIPFFDGTRHCPGRLSKVTPKMGYLLHPETGRTHRFELKWLAWWYFMEVVQTRSEP